MTSRKNTVLFEKFEIIECLKKDEDSSVYLANQIYLSKRIILKTLKTDRLSDPSVLERFKREAKILARLDHPNIIKVLDFGLSDREFYISFEYYEGISLRHAIRQNQLSDPVKLQLVRQLLTGLAYAHHQQIIHRDIKPENLLINKSNNLKIADFGLAMVVDENNVTRKSAIVGTPGYFSPEQIRGEKLSPSSDIFSAGIVVYELFTGQNPCVGGDVGETINNILKLKPARLLSGTAGIPETMHSILKGMLRLDRRQRYKTVGEILNDLGDQHGTHVPDAATGKNFVRKKYRYPAGIFLMLLIIAALVYWLPQSDPGPESKKSITDLLQDSLTTLNSIRKETISPGSSDIEIPEEGDLLHSRENGQKNEPAPENFIAENMPVSGLRTNEPVLRETVRPGAVMVQCMPWAKIVIDSVEFDVTPLDRPIELQPGTYQLSLKHPDYPAFREEIRVQEARLLNIAVDLDTLFGYLHCQVYPWGEVYVNGKDYGATPLLKPILLYPGSHRLKVVNPDYEAYEREVLIVKRDTVNLNLNLENRSLN